MYHHGICTLMLAEVGRHDRRQLGEEVRKKLEKAVAVILKAQRRRTASTAAAGATTSHGYDTDISVTGWQVMALRAAKNLGCDVPPEAIEQAVEYIKRCQDPTPAASATCPAPTSPSPAPAPASWPWKSAARTSTAAAEVLKAAGFLLKNPPRWGDEQFAFYGIYYCSQATFQLGGNYWNSYRAAAARDAVRQPERQRLLGRRRLDRPAYGPNYCTAMAVLALTVEYRFLPIYQRGEEPTEK